MPNITLRFYRNGSFSSRLIELTGRYSHVDALVTTSPGGVIVSTGVAVYGARSDRIGRKPPGVQYRKLYIGGPYEDLSMAVTSLMYSAFWSFLYSQEGKPYDYRCILGFLFDRDWHETDSWICSELQMAALQYAGVIPPLNITPNKITPGTLAVAFQVAGAIKV